MNKLEPDENYNCLVEYEDGDRVLVYANKLHNQNLDSWSGWACLAGMTRLYIDSTGTVWSCESRNHQLGQIGKPWAVYDSPGTCKQDRCGSCTDDLATEKSEK